MFAHTQTTDNFIFLHLNLSHLSYPSDMTFHPKNTPMFGKANRSLGTPQWVKLPGFLKLAASRTGLLGGRQSPVVWVPQETAQEGRLKTATSTHPKTSRVEAPGWHTKFSEETQAAARGRQVKVPGC